MQSFKKIVLLANTLFWFNGIICLLPGVVLIPIAESFQVGTHIIGYIFALFTAGNVIAVQCNGRLLEKVNIRTLLLLVIGLLLVSILGISSVSSLPLFSFFIFTYGIGNGFFSSTASYLIVNLYEDKERSTRLNLLHFFFSVGAIMSPLLSGSLVDVGVAWQTIYRLVLVLLIFVLILVWTTPIAIKKHPKNYVQQNSFNWNLSIYVIAVSLFCYTIAEGSFVFWGTTYFIEYLVLDTRSASSLISVFWFFMALGRILSGLILQRFPVEKYILGSSGLAFASSMFLLNSFDTLSVLLSISLMGLGFSGLYASILSYGTLQLPYPSAKLMSFYITFGSIGGVTAAPFSSWLKHSFSLKTSLLISGSFLSLVFALIGLAVFTCLKDETTNTKIPNEIT